ncbi:MAG TPA: EamA family transporter [Solirubrobacteraceae bacterium]|nr:EamA family transporter [Solirubrobacteraceae bacterium]
MLAILLALGTSISYGVSNFFGPLFGRSHPLAAVLLAGQVAALAGAVAIVAVSGDALPPAEGIWLGFLAGVGNIAGLAMFYRAAALGPVSIAAAIGALGTTLPVVFGVATGERLAVNEAAGIALAIAGAVLASQRGGPVVIPRDAAMWAALSAVGFGGFLIALPEAVDRGGIAWALVDARVAVVVLLVAGALALRAPMGSAPRALPKLAIPGLLLLLGTLMYAEATQRGLLSVVSVLASLATVVTATLSYFVLGERLSAVQRVGIAAATLGVVLLAL